MPDTFSFPPEAFRRMDENSDRNFYAFPRMVTHIDTPAIQAVTQLYREYFQPDRPTLDLMSSWISHLPEEMNFSKVVGLGMNEQELKANPRLDEFVVHDLNENPQLPFSDDAFAQAGICVSIDYLVHPMEVLKDLGRVLKADSPLVITFSNRCFPSKAIAIWLSLNDQSRMQLVQKFLKEAGNWTDIQSLDRSPQGNYAQDPLYAVVAKVKK